MRGQQPFDLAVASDLSRAAETAAILLDVAEGEIRKDRTLRMDPLLRERKFGVLES